MERVVGQLATFTKLSTYPGWTSDSDRRNPKGTVPSRADRIRKQFLDSTDGPFIMNWLDGIKVYIYPDDETSRVLYLTRVFEPTEFLLLSKILRPGMVFIDAGANIGLYSLFAAQVVGHEGRVVAIEPSNREFQRLTDNCSINGELRIEAVKVALSETTGTAELQVATDEHAGHNTLGSFSYPMTKLKEKERVELDTLDNVVTRHALHWVDVIKMDIEGGELLALRGATSVLERYRPVLFLELFDTALRTQGSSAQKVVDHLHGKGYLLYRFDGPHIAPLLEVPRTSENILAIHESTTDRWKTIGLPGASRSPNDS